LKKYTIANFAKQNSLWLNIDPMSFESYNSYSMPKGQTILIAIVMLLVMTVSGVPAYTSGTETGDVVYVPGQGMSVEALELTIEPSATIIFQGTPRTNKKEIKEFAVTYVGYLQFTKKFGKWAKAFLEVKQGWGDRLEEQLSLFANVNYNAWDVKGNIRARKFWYQQNFFDEQFTISSGQYNSRDVFAQNKYARDDDIQFLNWLMNRFPGIEWPASYCFTIHSYAGFEAIDFLEFEFNYFDADSDWEKVFHRGMATWQVNLKPASLLEIDPEQWEGNYRFYAWVNTRKHTKLVDAGEAKSKDTKEINYGFGLSYDQMITDVFAVFGRFGWQRPDIEPATPNATAGGVSALAWFTGAQMTGRYWNREDDVIAVAVGQIVPSGKYKDAGNPGRAEGHIEMYYRYQLDKCISISPDFQIIWNPDGDEALRNNPVFTYGARINIKI